SHRRLPPAGAPAPQFPARYRPVGRRPGAATAPLDRSPGSRRRRPCPQRCRGPAEYAMKVTPLAIADVLLIEPDVHGDARGYFYESYNAARLNAALGRAPQFVQDNHSRSVRHVVRGLHYQIRQPQAKLVRVAVGAIFDVAVDLRRSSPTFGKWTGAVLSADNKHQLWVPEGFAHGFMVLTDVAETL